MVTVVGERATENTETGGRESGKERTAEPGWDQKLSSGRSTHPIGDEQRLGFDQVSCCFEEPLGTAEAGWQ